MRGAVRDVSVAVKGERIAEVGDIAVLIGPRTRVVELGHRLLIPAFHDAHAHPVWGGLESLRCNLSGLPDLPAYRDAIVRYARGLPEGAWLTGAGWSMSVFPGGTPKAAQLDEACPDRPALLHNGDHHGAWVNSAALAIAGIDASTPDPVDGRIERDPDGTPTGTLHEGAVTLVTRHLPGSTAAEYEAGLRAGQAHMHALGVAGWQDAILGAYGGYEDASPAYRALAASGELTARVCGALWWDRALGASQIESLVARRASVGTFSTPMVKIMLDGVCENFTAAMSSPYLCGRGSGLSFVDFAELPSYVEALAHNGFGVHFHAIGDAAVRAALDAVERCPSGVSAQIAHLQVVRPDDVPRFAKLGVTANIQALWAHHEPQLDELALPFLGEERARWLYPFGDLARTGAPLAAGSDWPVSTADPWQAIHVAVNRSYAGGRVLLPEQRLDLATALTAYTEGSARANGWRDTGIIAPGMLADLAVLDRDPFAGPDDEIRLTQVAQTYVGGRLVFERA